jgi:hypothetical protein
MPAGTPTWLSDLANVGLIMIVLGVGGLILALLPSGLTRYFTVSPSALINAWVARPAYLLYLVVRGQREPEYKHAA